MELRARIPTLRRAAMMAALVALAAPATAGAAPTAHAAKAKKTRTVKTPVITAVAPMDVAVGEWLVLRGRHFVRGAKKNTVVFKRAGARAVFAKAEYGTAKLLKIQVPAALQAVMTPKDGNPSPTRFRVRVLARKFGRAFTATRLSPVVSPRVPPRRTRRPPPSPDGDCDGDGARNAADADDDNDNLDGHRRAAASAPTRASSTATATERRTRGSSTATATACSTATRPTTTTTC